MTNYSKVSYKDVSSKNDMVYGNYRYKNSGLSKIYPHLHDALVNHTIHPDGQPWKKCCGVDQKMKEATGIICRCALTDGRLSCKTVPFICCHRLTKDGHTRVCAGWHAKYGKNWNIKNNK